MSDVKITPGPWFIHDGIIPAPKDEKGYVGTYEVLNMEGYEDDVKVIGNVIPYGGKNYPDRNTAHANAKLIAASPDMLEAIQCALNLKDLWSAQQHGTVSADHAGEMEALQKMQDKLEAAIAKATT